MNLEENITKYINIFDILLVLLYSVVWSNILQLEDIKNYRHFNYWR